jgi:gas vesicle protein
MEVLMGDDKGGSNIAFFFAGLAVGAISALLFAPRSGEETRLFISQKANEGKDYVTAKGKELRKQAEELVEKGKDVVTQQKEQLAAAFDAGKQAYHDEKNKR